MTVGLSLTTTAFRIKHNHNFYRINYKLTDATYFYFDSHIRSSQSTPFDFCLRNLAPKFFGPVILMIWKGTKRY
jgi:hypothetical protein